MVIFVHSQLKILIVGGYGIFGGRLAELLKDEAKLTLIIAGRSLAKAQEYCETCVEARAILKPDFFDRAGDLDAQIAALQPDIIIDASGPFQSYGKERYRLVEACISNRVNYLDLADGSEFVKGISVYDEAAKAAGIFILSGVSSFPVLTALVVREISGAFNSIDTIYGGIAPSPYAGVGENVIRAIASYAGQPVTLKRNGGMHLGYPFTETIRYTVAPPGFVPLNNILFSLVDVPDLRVLPELWPEAKTIWMGAGPVPEILHRILIGFSWLVRWKILPSLMPMVKIIQFVMNTIRWGEHRGGMFVEVTGKSFDHQALKRSWHLLADGRDGPFIPCMAIEAVIRKLLEGNPIKSGARNAINDLVLADYDSLFTKKTIYTGFREDRAGPAVSLYKRLLGSSWEKLPSEIQEMHDYVLSSGAKGFAVVERGNNFVAKIIANLIGFPEAGTDVPVSVKFTVKDGIETWWRTFNNKSFISYQSQGCHREDRLLVERFGPMRFAMALVAEQDGKLRLVLRRWSVLNIPMPMFLCPRSDSYEIVENGLFNFHVHISHPFIGTIVRYRGWLKKI